MKRYTINGMSIYDIGVKIAKHKSAFLELVKQLEDHNVVFTSDPMPDLPDDDYIIASHCMSVIKRAKIEWYAMIKLKSQRKTLRELTKTRLNIEGAKHQNFINTVLVKYMKRKHFDTDEEPTPKRQRTQ